MAQPVVDPHAGLHSEQGSRRGEHPGRSTSPVITVMDLAWLELEKPDLARTETFARDFGFAVAHREPGVLHLRGTRRGPPCLVVRQGVASRLTALALRAADRGDLHRVAAAEGARVVRLPPEHGGHAVDLRDPSGLPVRVVHGTRELAALPDQAPLPLNVGPNRLRLNRPQRPAATPARVQRLGHVVLESPVFRRALDWYLNVLGMIASDFLHLPGQRDRGPAMAFLRCDRGEEPVDHHTIAMHLGPAARYVHSAYQVTDLDALARGGVYLAERGYQRSWGIGRHSWGSQVFDYWRDPDRLLVEHFTDGDLFDSTVPTGWAPMTASGFAQWGPSITTDFLGGAPTPSRLRQLARALREDNEIDPARLLALVTAMSR
ncbi:MAG: VOC family protein [Dermatophilaceae bacterium]